MKPRDPNAFLRMLYVLPLLAMPLWAWVMRRRRARDLERIAPSLGLSFHKNDRLTDALQKLPLMQRFTGRVSNVLRGKAGEAELVLFDYSWKPFWSNDRAEQTLAAYHLPGRGLPEFELRPEGTTDRLVAKLGFQDVDFDSHPGFSASYRLKTDDEGAIRTIFCPELLEHFEREAEWSLEGKGAWLAAYRAERLVAPSDLQTFIEQTTRIAERVRNCTTSAAPGPGPRLDPSAAPSARRSSVSSS